MADDVIRTALDLELAEGTGRRGHGGGYPCFLGHVSGGGRVPSGLGSRRSSPAGYRRERAPLGREETSVAGARKAEAVPWARSKAVVITGGPGVGKTTIVDAILRILAAKGVELVLCAPTGRAARRMSEATGLEARTIHRLLEVDPRSGSFRRDADNPLGCGLLVVDEASMAAGGGLLRRPVGRRSCSLFTGGSRAHTVVRTVPS